MPRNIISNTSSLNIHTYNISEVQFDNVKAITCSKHFLTRIVSLEYYFEVKWHFSNAELKFRLLQNRNDKYSKQNFAKRKKIQK